ncbi:MAG: branched-chain amino acid ABC transporter permease [Deltaproteobacteria bacterium]|nr:branched-chain amino acid ABC transporter permease [Deltaproteobacteria bacterium]
MAIRSRTFCETYAEDLQLVRTIWARFWLGVLLAVLLGLPFLGGAYPVYLANLSCIAIVGALGLNILTGFTGQISLGHSAFLALGAYTTALLAKRFGLPFWLLLPASGGVAAVAGIAVGLPCLRLKGLYLAMATMAFGVVVDHLVITWSSLTGGVRGLQVSPPDLFGHALEGDTKIYFFLVSVTAVMLVAAKNIVRTRVGRAFVAIRDRDVAAEALGVNLTAYKVLAFAIGSFYAGVAGGLYAYTLGYIQPEHFTFLLSVEYIAMNIVGGLGSVLGSVLGAVFIVCAPEAIKALAQALEAVLPSVLGQYNEEWNIAAFGLLIMLFLIFEPGGLNAIWGRVRVGFRNWPFTY